MAGPLINLLQGLQQRRQRRRSGWGGGDVPSMRNMINPLDSQDMTDRAQGIDIGSAAPMARLEARMAPPPQVAAQEDSEPAEAAPTRSPFMTAAGSNAKPLPMSNNQYGVRQYIQQQPAQCTGPNCPGGSGMGMGNIISERVTHINGVPVGGAAPATASTTTAGAATTVPAPQPFEKLEAEFNRMLENPEAASFAGLARATMLEAIDKNRAANAAGSISEKHYLRKEAYALGKEARQYMALATQQQDERRREQYARERQEDARRAMKSGTLAGKIEEAASVLKMSEGSPDDLAAMYVQYSRELKPATPQSAALARRPMEEDPEYQKARSIAHNQRIALQAANEFFGTGYAWGDDDARASNANLPWDDAVKYYGSMPIAQAQQEVDKRFTPAYLGRLNEINEALPKDKRRSVSDLQREAVQGGQMLKDLLYYRANPEPQADQRYMTDIDLPSAAQPAPQPDMLKSLLGAPASAWGGPQQPPRPKAVRKQGDTAEVAF